jgi:hypothetical protein
MSTSVIFANPGQTVTVAVQTLDGYGSRQDPASLPVVDYVVLPDSTQSPGFPVAMDKVSTGVYKKNVSIPTGASAVGSYIVSISWNHPVTGFPQYGLYIINVALPFGTSSVSPA